jgi:hypothetical protein
MKPQEDHCSWEKCSAGETGLCELGFSKTTDCSKWQVSPGKEGAHSPEQVQGAEAEADFAVRWSGRALGTLDLLSAAARGQVTVLGVIGPSDSGKTTFLLGMYLLLLKGERLGRYRFAGSWTLAGWEDLAAHARHTGDRHATFPPHTSAGEGRIPGLLHLALRDPVGRLRDVVWTDAPGEWFTTWATASRDPAAEGARWVERHADAFLLFADTERLSGPERGTAKSDLDALIHRMSPGLRERPVSLLWTKSDVVEKLETGRRERLRTFQGEIEEMRTRLLPGSTSQSVTILDPEGQKRSLEAQAALLDQALALRTRRLEIPVIHKGDPFLGFRGAP